VATSALGVGTDRRGWKHLVVVAVVAVVGTTVVYYAAASVVVGLGWSLALALLAVVLTVCGVATTAVGRLPLRWAYSVALLLWAGSMVWNWHLNGDVVVGFLPVLYLSGLFAVGATVGALFRRLTRGERALAALGVLVGPVALVLASLTDSSCGVSTLTDSQGKVVSEASSCSGPVIPGWLGLIAFAVVHLVPFVVTGILLARVHHRAGTTARGSDLATAQP
jgi:hypothetical protein